MTRYMVEARLLGEWLATEHIFDSLSEAEMFCVEMLSGQETRVTLVEGEPR